MEIKSSFKVGGKGECVDVRYYLILQTGEEEDWHFRDGR